MQPRTGRSQPKIRLATGAGNTLLPRRSGLPCRRLSAFPLILTVAALASLLSGCGSDGGGAGTSSPTSVAALSTQWSQNQTVSQVITPAGGSMQVPGDGVDLSLVFPAGAVSQTTTVSVTPITVDQLPVPFPDATSSQLQNRSTSSTRQAGQGTPAQNLGGFVAAYTVHTNPPTAINGTQITLHIPGCSGLSSGQSISVAQLANGSWWDQATGLIVGTCQQAESGGGVFTTGVTGLLTPVAGAQGPSGTGGISFAIHDPDGITIGAATTGGGTGTTTGGASPITEFQVPTVSSVPYQATPGPDGNVWFVENDTAGNKVSRITPAGVITEYPLPTGDALPMSLVAGPDGNLWVAEAGASKIARVTPSGTITEFSVPTAASNPSAIAAGPDGNLWFTEATGNAIGRITTAGAITEFPLPVANSHPAGITKGPDGNLWFTAGRYVGQTNGVSAQLGIAKVDRITVSGQITEFALPDPAAGPSGITTGPDGNLWAAGFGDGQVFRVTPTGNITSFTTPTSGSEPFSIVTGSDGNLWMTEYAANKIARITTAGVITEYPVPTGGGGPNGITSGPDGNIWFTEYNDNKIGRFSPSALGGGGGGTTGGSGGFTTQPAVTADFVNVTAGTNADTAEFRATTVSQFVSSGGDGVIAVQKNSTSDPNFYRYLRFSAVAVSPGGPYQLSGPVTYYETEGAVITRIWIEPSGQPRTRGVIVNAQVPLLEPKLAVNGNQAQGDFGLALSVVNSAP